MLAYRAQPGLSIERGSRTAFAGEVAGGQAKKRRIYVSQEVRALRREAPWLASQQKVSPVLVARQGAQRRA
eukprot:1159201-Pelagomonas_calceolata.AAC.16